MPKPLYDLVMKRKDNADIEYVDYKGETRTARSVKLGAIWPDRRDDSKPGSVSFEEGALVAFGKGGGSKSFWVDAYSTENRDTGRAPKRNAPSGGGSDDLF